MRLLVPLGTRPEIVKLAPVISELASAGHDVRTVATGQHFSPSMSDNFFVDLGLSPDRRWEPAGDEAERLGTMLTRALEEVADAAADAVVVLGDTWTVPLFCLAARRHHVPVVHLEAGLRSFNATSMEEVNRRVAAATVSLNLAPTEMAAEFLRREGVDEARIRVVGNPVIDVLCRRGVPRRAVEDRNGVVVTAHRATNVDDPERLSRLVDIVTGAAERLGPVTFPVHPRTKDRLDASGGGRRLEAAGVRLLEPLPYDDMLALLAASKVVLTDSGGLQEEASWLGVPAVVLRRSTPRWEGVASGASVLAGLDVDVALAAAERFCTPMEQRRVAAIPCPYGDGHTSERVAQLLGEPGTADLLRLSEPDFVDRPVPVFA